MPHIPGHDWSWGEGDITNAAFGTATPGGMATDLAGDIDWAQMRTPGQDWEAFTMGLTPDMNRIPLQNMRNQLMTRYALANPFQGDLPQSFAGWMGATPRAQQASGAELRARAQTAANVAGYSENEYLDALAAVGGPSTAAGRALAMQAQTWNPGQGGSAANQQAAAQLLALQRAGGGTYQGAMGNAMQRAMNAMYRRRAQEGQDPNTFLQWYLNQTAPA